MRYSLEIIQSADGEQNVVAVDAEGVLSGGVLTLAYSFDGDAYSLEISERGMTQKRTGGLNMHMQFKNGETTKCSFSDGARGGSFDIFTEEYQVDFGVRGCVVNCVFSDGAGGGRTRISTVARCAE